MKLPCLPNTVQSSADVFLEKGWNKFGKKTHDGNVPKLTTTKMITGRHYVNIISSCVLFTIGVVGNALVIVYFSSRTKYRRKMSCYHLFIVQLAVVDIFICVVIPITKIYTSSYGEIWNKSHFACVWLSFIPYHVATAVSGWLLVARSSFQMATQQKDDFNVNNLSLGSNILRCITHHADHKA